MDRPPSDDVVKATTSVNVRALIWVVDNPATWSLLRTLICDVTNPTTAVVVRALNEHQILHDGVAIFPISIFSKFLGTPWDQAFAETLSVASQCARLHDNDKILMLIKSLLMRIGDHGPLNGMTAEESATFLGIISGISLGFVFPSWMAGILAAAKKREKI